jgi:hypothetical protein
VFSAAFAVRNTTRLLPGAGDRRNKNNSQEVINKNCKTKSNPPRLQDFSLLRGSWSASTSSTMLCDENERGGTDNDKEKMSIAHLLASLKIKIKNNNKSIMLVCYS